MQFYFRHGAALSETDNARVQVGKQGASGYLTRAENCPRCGGAGGSTHWRPDGGVCYQCRGACKITRTHRVFSEAKLAKLNEAAATKAAKKAEAAQRKLAAERVEFDKWAAPHAKLLADIKAATGNSFLTDLATKLVDHRQLTERQLEAAATAVERQKQREAEGKASEYVGEIKERIEFEAEVTGVYGTEGYYGHTDIVKFKDAANNQFTWFASDYTDLERGDRISIKGTVKKHETYRDVKQTVLTRCKYAKFEVMTPDEAAQADGATLTGERVLLVYPEKRSVPASQIFTWHSDKVADGEIEAHTSDLRQAIADLEDLGHITTEVYT
jgi:hypothetical protein